METGDYRSARSEDNGRSSKRPRFESSSSRSGSRKRERDSSDWQKQQQQQQQQQQRAYLEKDAEGKNVLKFGTRPAAAAKEPTHTAKSEEVQAEQKENISAEQARTYQLEVLEQAKSRNTIAFLETGAGKTLIAVLLMRSKSEVLGRKMLAVFLVPKVPLVYQQAEVIQERTNFRIGHYCGEMGQDFWDSRRWHREIESKEVFVMTAQILLNILRHSILKMEDIDLLILDECHHAVKKHPYSLVMSEFYHLTPRDKRPSVFGMTASPVNMKGVSSQHDCAVKIRNLETKLDSIVCTIRDRKELEKYVPMPSETVIEYDRAALLWSLREQIKQVESAVTTAAGTNSKRTKWQFMGARDAGVSDEIHLEYGVAERTETDGAANLLQKLRAIIYSLDELGQWCAYKVASSFLTSLRNDERAVHQSDVKYQEGYLVRVTELLQCELKEGAAFAMKPSETQDVSPMDVEDGEICDTKVVSGGEHLDQILGAAVADGKVTPKVQCLIKLLLKYQHTDDFRAIIFVDRVVAASVLPKVLSELPSLQFLTCASLIGHNNNQEMRSCQMQESIAKFRDGRVTLLVATSVAEEGLDIRQCNVVIRFDLAKTVLAYIQSRGRARKPGSDYILMVEKGNKMHQSFLRNARNSEETLRKEAAERTVLDWTKEAEIQASIEAAHEEIYKVASGAMVSLNSAVGLVHFYCSQLPSDRYSVLKPEFIIKKYRENDSINYSCCLQLPCNAPLESVDGPLSTTIKKAQQSACLEACKRLHELGAFTDMLLPDKGEKGGDKVEDLEHGEPLPGTARYREYFPEGIADILKGDWIVDGPHDVYMYKVQSTNIGSTKDPLTIQASEFAVLFGREVDAEVLTMSMDLFVARTLTAKVSLDYSGRIRFSSEQIDQLKKFHMRLMSIVLDVNVDPFGCLWDTKKAYLLVPLSSGTATCQVDWALINEVLKPDAWSNALQKPRPDAYLGTDERALGGDRREYGFGKLRYESQKHPTYGVKGAVASYKVVKAAGLEHMDRTEPVEPREGFLLMADGFVNYESIKGKIVTAAHSGKRFYVESIRLDMTADSSFPRKEGYLGPVEYASYADYYKQKYGVDLLCRNQPMIRARGVSHCKNLLSPRFCDKASDGFAAEELTEKTYYVMLPAELCLNHPLPGCVVRGAQRLPSVMRRVESMLLAIQLKHEIGYPISAWKVLEALTAASCQETFCYERAELLGDAFLKWVVSRRLFLKFPSKHEGQLTRMRQQIVSNAVLYEFALSKRLQGYIQADRFSPSRWTAPGVPLVFEEDVKDRNDEGPEAELSAVSGNGTLEIEIQDDSSSLEEGEIEGDMSSYRVLSSKTLADVVEALIGVYYVQGGQKATTHLMGWLGIPIDYEVSDAEKAKAGCIVPETVMNGVDLESLEGALGYKFRSKNLLLEAISHASRPSAGIPCYQRLEFVGDAVLDHLITRYLFFQYSDLPPGRLTDLRAAAVNNENFARLSVKHGLHLHLRHGSSALETQIRDFVKDIQGELDKPGINSFGIGDFKAPKVLGDILESIAGAIFLDTGLEMDAVWRVFEALLQPIVTPETLPVHPVRELQERCQQQAEDLEYKASRAGSTATVEVFVDGVQISAGQSTQRKMAQKLAARNALAVLKEKDNGTTKDKQEKKTFTRQTLNDICLKRQWPMPHYKMVNESGPAHAKRFTFTVQVNMQQLGWTEECEGQSMPSVKKAKDSAAMVLLELLKHSSLD